MGCFLIGATGKGFTRGGDALLGSVSDDPYDIRTFMRLVKPAGCLAHLGTELISTSEHSLTERGYFARPGETTRGINEAGLSFTAAMIMEDESFPKTLHATIYANLTDHMMRHCKTVEEALDLFSSKEAVTPAYSVLLADANGSLAHIEVGSFGMAIHEHFSSANPGAVFAVNCYLSPKLETYNAPLSFINNPDNNNQARRFRGQQLADLFKGKLDVESLAKILSDHQNRDRDPMDNPLLPAWGYSICNHGTRKQDSSSPEDYPWGTVSAEILKPAQKQFWYAYGWPCGEKPEFGDQLFQEKSWGEFIPFGFPEKEIDREMVQLTNPEGMRLPLQ